MEANKMNISVKSFRKDNKLNVVYSFDNGLRFNKVITKEKFNEDYVKTDEYRYIMEQQNNRLRANNAMKGE